MSFDAERLYDLLPAIFRVRDDEERRPLQALLSVIAEQVAVVEEDLAQLYDDQFIETCAEWVVPYIGDLVGARGLYDLRGTVSQRAQVANTLAYRRRKGTAAVFEQVARDVTGWNAHAVEFFEVLATTQHMNHIRASNLSSPNLRQWEPLERADTLFDALSYTAEVRRIANRRGSHNIPNVGVFLWRLGAYPVTRSPAFKLVEEDENDRRFRFSPLGDDTTLFNLPVTEARITNLAEPLNVPIPISRRVLDSYLADHYGRSLQLFEGANEIPVENVVVCDLSGWVRKPEEKYAIDPVLGRIASPEKDPDGQNRDAPSDLRVTYHYGFGADIGGGEYGRGPSPSPPAETVSSGSPASIQQALDRVRAGGFVEVTDSGRYREALNISVNAQDRRIEVRARDGRRPHIVLQGDLNLAGVENTEVTLDGLLISGAALRVVAGTADNGLRRLRLRHCTLVPGLSLEENGAPRSPSAPGLIVGSTNIDVEIDHCIVGGLRVANGNRVLITNSIVDAAESREPSVVNINTASAAQLVELPHVGRAISADILRLRRRKGRFRSVDELEEVPGIGPATLQDIRPFATVFTVGGSVAYAALDEEEPGGTLRVENSTILGRVHTSLMELASNTIFLGDLDCERLQQGCVRFSYLPLTSRAPRRHRCRPEDEAEVVRMRPQFSSLQYGRPDYCQLSQLCAAEIRQGADDEAEMGAFHDLYQPQRESNLRVRLEEYLRFGLEAGVFYAS